MKVYSVFDPEFKPYGQVVEGCDVSELLAVMEKYPLPESGTLYERSLPEMEACAVFEDLQQRVYGGMPIQLGLCWGRNDQLNCLEYHRDSELNLSTRDLVMLYAKQDEIENGVLDTAKVKAFRVPAGVLVECYATTLHYAPCHLNEQEGFRMAVALPRGTNGPRPGIEVRSAEDRLLLACNKWLLAHPDSRAAAAGADVGRKGENIRFALDRAPEA